VEACWAHNPEVRGSKPRSAKILSIFLQQVQVSRSVSVVVITSALHAEGRQFDPGTDHMYFVPCCKHVRMAEWSKAPDSRLMSFVP
jgi:hypothetical protein